MKARLVVLASVILSSASAHAGADVLVQVDQSTQRMSVDVDGQQIYDWRVSSGRPGYDTPNGDFRPNRMDADHFSKEYDNAPMPHAIFFDLHGHAIHGSYDPVGHPAASHGCVRLDPANAAKLFFLVKKEGMAHTQIEITGDVRIALATMKPERGKRLASRRTPARGRGQTLGVIYGQAAAYGEPADQNSRYGAYYPDSNPYGGSSARNQTYGYPAYNHPVWSW